MDLLAVLSDLVGGVLILAKEYGKGGGGSTEEPTVCMSLLPIGLGVVVAASQSLRRRWRGEPQG
jgi:hypothetical protein